MYKRQLLNADKCAACGKEEADEDDEEKRLFFLSTQSILDAVLNQVCVD